MLNPEQLQILQLLCTCQAENVALAEQIAIGLNINIVELIKIADFGQLDILKPEDFVEHTGLLEGNFEDLHLENFKVFKYLQPEHLSFQHCLIDTLEGLDLLTQLTSLRIYRRELKDISNLQYLTRLESLILPACGIHTKDLDAFKNLSKLSFLRIEGNRIESLAPLPGLSGLNYLDCSENLLADLNGIEKLDKLESLECNKNEIKDLKPLKKLPLLGRLSCYKNQLTSLEGLENAPNLSTLSCSHNPIADFDILATLPKLHRLEIANTKLNSLQQLSLPKTNLYNYFVLSCSNNLLWDLEGIEKISHLTTLYCGNNPIKSLEPLQANKNLTHLNCEGTKIRNLRGLEHLQFLEHLDCSNTLVEDLSPLFGLPKLETLKIKHCPALTSEHIQEFRQHQPNCELIC